ncbi:MAG TPA: magnesium transporter CorA family protein, partial [Nitrososphaeraceae archaeon]|nr:magnesium transporter CorA family protein [Nitrososphaeraceae archaeon]
DNIAIRPVNIISEAVSIRTEMKKIPEEYLWIHANEIEDIFPLQDIFGLHPLTVEAILHHNQPSKIEEYSRYIFAIIDGIADNQEKKMDDSNNNNNKNNEKILSMMVLEDDLYMYLEHRWIITLNVYNQHFEENVKKNVKTIIQQTKLNMPNSTPFSMDYDIIDNNKKNILKKNELIFRLALEEMILSYFPIIDNIGKDIEQTEEDILAENSGIYKSDKLQLSTILLLRKKISFIERTLGMMSRAVQDFVHRNKIASNNNNKYSSVSDTLSIKSDKQSIPTKSTSTLLSPDSISQIYSLNDRITYLRHDVENMHQRIISLRETYNSSLSANLNETIRTLTVIATIVLPLTLITGIYGMNFEFMPELTSKYGYYYALGLIAALGGGMILYFKRKRWI